MCYVQKPMSSMVNRASIVDLAVLQLFDSADIDIATLNQRPHSHMSFM